jgi:excisionase family DNA binding protein
MSKAGRYATVLPECLSRSDVAARLSVSVDTIDRAIKDGRLTAYRLGKRVVVRAPDVQAWLRSAQLNTGGAA